MDAARAEAALRDLEAAAFARDQVVRGNAHVVEGDVAVAVGRVVVAEHREHPGDLHARRVHRHQHHRLALVRRRVGVGLCP